MDMPVKTKVNCKGFDRISMDTVILQKEGFLLVPLFLVMGSRSNSEVAASNA